MTLKADPTDRQKEKERERKTERVRPWGHSDMERTGVWEKVRARERDRC